jgi:dipeptidase E
MKKYLSSYRLWDNPERLFDLFWDNKKIAYIGNACDIFTDVVKRKKRDDIDISDLKNIWLIVEQIDLRDYFWKSEALGLKIQEFWGVFVSGWNTFVLRQSYQFSWLDDILINYETNNPNFIYAWYSAGICILSPSLHGLDIVDDSNTYPYDSIKQTIWEWLWILEFSIAPHYNSLHPESKLVDDLVTYCIKNKILFKALKDGEVLICN